MTREEFVTYAVLHNGMDPETAVRVHDKMKEALLEDWNLPSARFSPSGFVGKLIEELDSFTDKNRATLFSVLREMYDVYTGVRRK